MSVINALTVDVEDFAHVSAYEHRLPRNWWDLAEPRWQRGLYRLLELCAETGKRGTFFILGWLARRYPQLVRDIARAGHEVGCHSYWHRLVYHLTPTQFRQDLRSSIHVLEDILGQPVTTYRAPSFSITRRSAWALEIMRQEGILIDCSVFPTFHYRYGWREVGMTPQRVQFYCGELIVFPMSTFNLSGYPFPIGGGGYLRLYPLAVTEFALIRRNHYGHPFTIYIHPWELDGNQPRIRLSPLAWFQHHVNQGSVTNKLRQLFTRFVLGTVTVACQAYLSKASTNGSIGPKRAAPYSSLYCHRRPQDRWDRVSGAGITEPITSASH